MTPERIQEAREARGLTPDELAERVGVSTETILAWESGRERPRFTAFGFDYRMALCRALDFPPGFFRQRPSEPLGPTSMDWHMEITVCDQCDERIEYGDHVKDGEKDYHFGCDPRPDPDDIPRRRPRAASRPAGAPR